MSEFPLPHRHEASPPKRELFAAGKSVPRNGIVTFPAQTPIEHDVSPGRECRWCGATRAKERHRAFCDDARARNVPYRTPEPASPWAKLPTPPEQYDTALVASILIQATDTLMAMCANLRKLAETLHEPRGAA